ncbi:hypothetical protein [Edaphobacter modestus]|uniref:Uncharacterized protein n=1 Tax=Edaphobacter modestus TaxID=388466 RepID=A0A4Q7YGI5_9BACT|nr:hypothetical protein [Edaphobacter modestus]RZU35439.1 hypothetical protein BDD14_5487 [Edaphobacter modestus]
MSEKIDFNRSTTVNFYNNTSLTLNRTGFSCEGDSILHNVAPPSVIQPGQQVQWIQKVSSLQGYSNSYASYGFSSGGSLTVEWSNPISSGNTYSVSCNPSSDYNITYTGGSGTEATISVDFVQKTKLDITFYNQNVLELTLDPASIQIQDGEFITQPPASIAAGGQASWTMDGVGFKGSCHYWFDSVSGAKLSWDTSNNQYSIDAEPTYEYTGNTSGSTPSVSFYVQLQGGGLLGSGDGPPADGS